MLSEKLSTDLTSLNVDAERLSVVVEMVIGIGEQSEIIPYSIQQNSKSSARYI
jgi:exoribonuclease R